MDRRTKPEPLYRRIMRFAETCEATAQRKRDNYPNSVAEHNMAATYDTIAQALRTILRDYEAPGTTPEEAFQQLFVEKGRQEVANATMFWQLAKTDAGQKVDPAFVKHLAQKAQEHERWDLAIRRLQEAMKAQAA